MFDAITFFFVAVNTVLGIILLVLLYRFLKNYGKKNRG